MFTFSMFRQKKICVNRNWGKQGVDLGAFFSRNKQQAKDNQTIENESKEPYLTETKIKCFLIV